MSFIHSTHLFRHLAILLEVLVLIWGSGQFKVEGQSAASVPQHSARSIASPKPSQAQPKTPTPQTTPAPQTTTNTNPAASTAQAPASNPGNHASSDGDGKAKKMSPLNASVYWQGVGFIGAILVICRFLRPRKKGPERTEWEEGIQRKKKRRLTKLERFEVWFEELREDRGLQLILLGSSILVILCCNVWAWHGLKEQYHPIEVIEKLGEALAIAAVVSWIFDVGYHQSTFGNHVERIKAAIDQLSNSLGYLPFRGRVLKEFKHAERRIVSISDYWATDLGWWENQTQREKWTELPLYQSLWEALKDVDPHAQDKPFLHITFGGKGVWPSYKLKNPKNPAGGYEDFPTFTEQEMRRFLGIMWRLVVCHKVRRAYREKWENKLKGIESKDLTVPLRVVITSAPIQATIIDNEVFVLFPGENPDDVSQSMAFHITPTASSESAVKVQQADMGDAYMAILNRNLRSARSAREYVESIFVLMMHADSNTGFRNTLLEGNEPIQEMKKEEFWEEQPFSRMLKKLGLKAWAEWEENLDEGRLGDNVEERMKAAFFLANEFRQTLPKAGSLRSKVENSRVAAKDLKFSDLMEDLF